MSAMMLKGVYKMLFKRRCHTLYTPHITSSLFPAQCPNCLNGSVTVFCQTDYRGTLSPDRRSSNLYSARPDPIKTFPSCVSPSPPSHPLLSSSYNFPHVLQLVPGSCKAIRKGIACQKLSSQVFAEPGPYSIGN